MPLAILVRAVIRIGPKLLACRLHTQPDIVFLPGGHVESNESIEGALLRELAEELPGVLVKLRDYRGAIEHHYRTRDGRHERELNHFFEAQTEGLSPDVKPPSGESHVENFWLNLSDLKGAGLKPRALVAFLRQGPHGDQGPWWATEVE